MQNIRYCFMAVLCIALCQITYAQNAYYSPEGSTILEISTEKAIIKFHESVTFEQQQNIFNQFNQLAPLHTDMVLPSPKVVLAELKGITNVTAVYHLLSQLRQLDEVVYANHFLMHKDGTAHGITDRALVRLNTAADLEILQEMASIYGATVEKPSRFDHLLYHVKVVDNQHTNALTVANQLYELGLFDYAEPDFLRLMKRMNTNDTFVGSQWSLNNDGVNTASYGGVAGADMKVFNAWATTTGSTNIKVAILDEGVDLNHPDLLANMLGGYDATQQNSGGHPSGNDAHGTACAGIVAGVGNNSTGVAGVAYTAKIIPIRIAYSSGSSWVTSNAWIGDALTWAVNTGNADILSNSWGGGGSSSTINNAIDNAVNNGRGGLGSPVLFAAGNDNGANSYPATYAPTISVIAMSMCNQRKNPNSCDGETWWGSNYGTGADIAAPGVKIYATDISGSAGYSSGDYTPTFNGTSSATPNAAGVMALILSANGSLTEAQARAAIEGTCDKVGGYTYNSGVSGQGNGTWSNDLGYGRVNAEAAVLSVAPTVNDDAGISNVSSPTGNICSTSAAATVTLRNNGANTLTSVTINYQLDGGAVNTQNWTGALASLASTTVSLPNVTFTSGAHTFTAYTSNPNGQTDNNPANDSANSSFVSGSNNLTLSITLDNYPEETSWEIKDSGGNTVATGGTYGSQPDGSTVTESICLADGCFDFTIYDTYGDGICCSYGNGAYSLTNDADGSVLASGGTFTSSEVTNFCVTNAPPTPLTVSANGTDVSCGSSNDGTASATGSGGSGSITYSWTSPNGFTASGASISGLAAGTYTVTATDGSGSTATDNITIADANSTYYADGDGDGYGDAANAVLACSQPAGFVTDNTDCQDGNAAINPGATEVCDGIDNNCDGNTDEGLTQNTYYADTDGDGYGDAANSMQACVQPAGYVINNTDCNDGVAAINPGATEVCDGIDNNCDGNTDEGLTQNTYYADTDGDGYGDAANSMQACVQPAGYVTNNTDCNDGVAAVNPGATEVCDGIDNNCDGNTDEGFALITYYADADGDGYGDAANSIQAACGQPTGYVTDNTDCHDGNSTINPGATEICDGIDNNCDGVTDDANCGGGCTYSVIDANDFEAGWGIWIDGGSDAARSSNATYASSGTYSIQLRDNTSTSVMTTSNLDLSSYDELTVDFGYYPTSMDNSNEDFWLQISTDGGTSYTTVEEWNRDDEFVNNQHYTDAVVIPGPFTSSTRLRFRCDASGNSDWVYIDDVTISGCSGSGGNPCIAAGGDADGDGVCANDDCDDTNPNIGASQTPGTSCDDGDANTTGDAIQSDGCTCAGTPVGGGCTYVSIDNNDFESGWGIWNDGGSDCRRSINDAAYAFNSSYCVRLRDNTTTSVMTTNNLDLTNYEEVTVDFIFIANSMENGEDFWLQISTDGGASYTTVADYNSGTSFVNGQFYTDAVVIAGPFSSTTRLRFRCDASANGDQVFIDDVAITGCATIGSQMAGNDDKGKPNADDQNITIDTPNFGAADIQEALQLATKTAMTLYPNPVAEQLTVEFSSVENAAIQLIVTDISGRMIQQQNIQATATKQSTQMDVSSLAAGYYLLHLVTDTERITQKFVVVK